MLPKTFHLLAKPRVGQGPVEGQLNRGLWRAYGETAGAVVIATLHHGRMDEVSRSWDPTDQDCGEADIETLLLDPPQKRRGAGFVEEDNQGGPILRNIGGIAQRRRIDPATTDLGQDLVETDALRKLLD